MTPRIRKEDGFSLVELLIAMALAGIAPAEMRPVALQLNVLVSAIAAWKFWRAGHFRWALFWPFAAVSIPAAYVGGAITLPGTAYRILVGLVLLYAGWQLWWIARHGEELRPTEAGILVGVVRRRPGGEPLPRAVVKVEATARSGQPRFQKATVTSANPKVATVTQGVVRPVVDGDGHDRNGGCGDGSRAQTGQRGTWHRSEGLRPHRLWRRRAAPRLRPRGAAGDDAHPRPALCRRSERTGARCSAPTTCGIRKRDA